MTALDRFAELHGWRTIEELDHWRILASRLPPTSIQHDLARRIDKPVIFERVEAEALLGEKNLTLDTHLLDPSGDPDPGLDRLAIGVQHDDTAAIARLLDQLLSRAITLNASDIHLDNTRHHLRVSFRLQGILRSQAELPTAAAALLISRIKLLANLDITEHRMPQDGRLGIELMGQQIDLRVATFPTQQGERAVLRIFRSRQQVADLDSLGFPGDGVARMRSALASQAGLILVSGPTGSGKTSTIYAMLNSLAGRGLNIMTIEDPVEVEIPMVVQTQVNAGVGFDFARGLRAILRNDPDVILVGEIRDAETANVVTQAALTGHLVIATVHANSTEGAVSRLVNLGVDDALLADALIASFGQRLIRIYCQHCQSTSRADPAHLEPLPHALAGCEHCAHTGFGQRVPVMEWWMPSRDDRHHWRSDGRLPLANTEQLSRMVMSLHRTGRTPMSEVIRVGRGLNED